jgi:mannose-6-phosphate isomerase-like protein (cupin superfamily)
MTSDIDQGTKLTALDPSAPHRQAIWLLNSLMVERATAQDTNGAYTMFEQWVTADGNPPPHVHEREDEAFLVLEGSIDVTVGGETTHVTAGGFAFGPRGVPHSYAVTSDLARLLIIATPGGSEHFFRQLGEPAQALGLPVPAAPDVPRVVSVAAQHGIAILPPPAS